MAISITSGIRGAAPVAAVICAAAALPLFGVNPITPEGEFLSDPAPRKGPDGALYIFGSCDELSASGAYCSHFNDVFETRDLRAWKIRRGVLASVGANDGCAIMPPIFFGRPTTLNGKSQMTPLWKRETALETTPRIVK